MKKNHYIIGGLTLLFVASIVVNWPFVFGWHRPYVNWSAPDLAKYLVERKRPAKECMDLIWFEIMAPSQGETRALCVYEYAKLAKDPAACELLMPSSYGWSCLSGAQETADACSFDDGKNVAWRLGDDVNDPWENATIAQCKNNEVAGKQGKDCCYMFLLTKDSSDAVCSRFVGEEKLMDTCLSELALRKKDLSFCQNITDGNKKVICELQAKYSH